MAHQSTGCIARDLVERMHHLVGDSCLCAQDRDVTFGVGLMQWSVDSRNRNGRSLITSTNHPPEVVRRLRIIEAFDRHMAK
jgi:hypothetical protein